MMFERDDRRAARTTPVPQPTDADRLDPGVCLRCGFLGPHFDAYDCIGALRDRLAMFERRRENRRAAAALSARRRVDAF